MHQDSDLILFLNDRSPQLTTFGPNPPSADMFIVRCRQKVVARRRNCRRVGVVRQFVVDDRRNDRLFVDLAVIFRQNVFVSVCQVVFDVFVFGRKFRTFRGKILVNLHPDLFCQTSRPVNIVKVQI